MTTIVPYTIYSIPFFNFVQILTQISAKKMQQPFRPGCRYVHIKEVYLRGAILTKRPARKIYEYKTKLLLYTLIIFQIRFLSKEIKIFLHKN